MNRKTIIHCTALLLLTACSGTASQGSTDANGHSASVMEQVSSNGATADDNSSAALYVGKKFVVGWRHVKLNRKPTDYIEEFYREYDEIIYLKQLN
jgi:hypothetical protein